MIKKRVLSGAFFAFFDQFSFFFEKSVQKKLPPICADNISAVASRICN